MANFKKKGIGPQAGKSQSDRKSRTTRMEAFLMESGGGKNFLIKPRHYQRPKLMTIATYNLQMLRTAEGLIEMEEIECHRIGQTKTNGRKIVISK